MNGNVAKLPCSDETNCDLCTWANFEEVFHWRVRTCHNLWSLMMFTTHILMHFSSGCWAGHAWELERLVPWWGLWESRQPSDRRISRQRVISLEALCVVASHVHVHAWISCAEFIMDDVWCEGAHPHVRALIKTNNKNDNSVRLWMQIMRNSVAMQIDNWML